MTNHIGLNATHSKELAKLLDELLANYQVFYMNVRGYHWNIKGANFFELHAKFEEVYNDLIVKIDELAERILTLGYQPLHSYSQYIALSEIKEETHVSNGNTCVQGLVNGFQMLIAKQRHILDKASEASDEGSASQMSDYIKEQEKLLWMFNAYLAQSH